MSSTLSLRSILDAHKLTGPNLAVCFHCNKLGHWKRNYKVYLAELKKKKGSETTASDSGMFMIEINMSLGLNGSRTLEKDEVILRMGNGARVAAISVGSFSLHLPTGKTIILNNCYYVPSIVRNIVSIPMLDLDGFSFIIKNNKCSILRDNVLYECGILNNGLLGHISENRLQTLHKEGLLDPFDFESYPTCESCLLGKMTKSPFSGHGERAADLLGLVHTDVCGPMSTQATGGFSYFITFIDDKSRFRYVYLMKHKSEAFEKFKEYKHEVEKQTKHSIITLRSDRGGEYLNGEFLDYLKENAYLLNKVPSKSVPQAPYEIWKERKLSLKHVKIWGCPAYVKKVDPYKMESRSVKFKVWLSKNFTMKDLGEASYILGMKIYRDRFRRMIGLTQGTYIQKVLKRFSMKNSKRGLIPMSHGVSLSDKMPDVAYSISVTSRYQSNPGEDHWKAVKNILKYLRRTQNIFLVFGGESELKIEGYTDSSFQSESDSKSMSGYMFTLNGGAISWKSSKQSTTADSTAEAEYIAASEAAKEAVWMRKFVSELGVVPSVEEPIVLYCDNNAAIAQAKEPSCNSLQGLKGSRTLEKDEVILRMGKGARVAAISLGSFSLHMPTGKTIILNNCYYIPSIVRNIVSIPMLDLDGFSFIIKNNECSILRDNVLYGRGILNNGLLGHISENRLRTLHKEGLLDPFDFESYPTCESCLLGKMTKSPFSGHGERAADLLGLVHTDVCGPMSKQAMGEFSYFITFIDDKSRFRYVYLMKHKSEAFEKFKEYKHEVEKQTKHSIITLRSDRGGEYLNGEFLDYLKKNGIVSQWTPPYTPQLNGVPSKSVPQAPYQIWKERKPCLKHVKIWGCPVYVKKVDPDKLESRSVKCNFVGYPKETLGYYFYIDHRVFVSRHATFLEKQFILEENSGSKIELDEPIRRTGRVSHQPERYYGLVIENDNEFSIIDDDDPVTYNEAMSSVDSEKWHSAMKSEMESMYTNQVWTLVEAPEGVKPIGCKWVYKRKIGADGQVETYKARLMAKGFKQRQGIDFDETFSPVVLLKSIRILLAIAAYYDYEIWQMDVNTAFLNGELEEEVYMTQPEGFLSKGNEHLVCKLLGTIYGLRQASRRWNIRFDETIKEFGFIKNIDEPCVYKKVSGSAVTFLVFNELENL
ncbi:hypothetical protein AgCh_016205 [Apium graveolens]